jgi:hypothetical protein
VIDMTMTMMFRLKRNNSDNNCRRTRTKKSLGATFSVLAKVILIATVFCVFEKSDENFVQAKKGKKKTKEDETMEYVNFNSPSSLDASNLMASIGNQGLLSRSSGKVDELVDIGETAEDAMTREDEFLMMDDGTNGDSPKTASVLAGDLSMDLGTTGSIGGIPDDIKKETDADGNVLEEMFDEEYDGAHRMHAKGHALAFACALLACAIFVNFAFGSFFVVRRSEPGWANLPVTVEFSRDAKNLFNSVDKDGKI